MKPFTKKIVLESGREFYGYGFGANQDEQKENEKKRTLVVNPRIL